MSVLLEKNTQALLDRFAAENARLHEEVELKLQRLREASRHVSQDIKFTDILSMQRPALRGMVPRGAFPWP